MIRLGTYRDRSRLGDNGVIVLLGTERRGQFADIGGKALESCVAVGIHSFGTYHRQGVKQFGSVVRRYGYREHVDAGIQRLGSRPFDGCRRIIRFGTYRHSFRFESESVIECAGVERWRQLARVNRQAPETCIVVRFRFSGTNNSQGVSPYGSVFGGDGYVEGIGAYFQRLHARSLHRGGGIVRGGAYRYRDNIDGDSVMEHGGIEDRSQIARVNRQICESCVGTRFSRFGAYDRQRVNPESSVFGGYFYVDSVGTDVQRLLTGDFNRRGGVIRLGVYSYRGDIYGECVMQKRRIEGGGQIARVHREGCEGCVAARFSNIGTNDR